MLNSISALSQEAEDTLITTTNEVQDSLSVAEGDDAVEEEEYNYYEPLVFWSKDSLHIRQVPDSTVAALKNQEAFWYADKDFRKEVAEKKTNRLINWLAMQTWYRIVAWMIIIGSFAAVLIWFLIDSNVRIFRKKAKNILEIRPEEEDIFSINFYDAIHTAEKNGNYRMAVRFRFLFLLKQLAEKNIIQYKEDATNFDYLMQVSQRSFYKDFFTVVRYYEYVWYGNFLVNEKQYAFIKSDFESLQTKV